MTQTVEELAVDLGETVACEWPECGDEAAWRTRVRCKCDHSYYRLLCAEHAVIVRLAVALRVMGCSICPGGDRRPFARNVVPAPGGHSCPVDIVGEVAL